MIPEPANEAVRYLEQRAEWLRKQGSPEALQLAASFASDAAALRDAPPAATTAPISAAAAAHNGDRKNLSPEISLPLFAALSLDSPAIVVEIDPQGHLWRGYQHWKTKVRNGRLPRRADLHPEEIAPLLPYIYLIDIDHEPLSFRFRLVGTKICELADRDYTGVLVCAADYGPAWLRMSENYKRVMRTQIPYYAVGSAPWVAREFLTYHRILCPLSSDGVTVDMMFGVLDHVPPEST